jgi:flagellar motor protein MotB
MKPFGKPLYFLLFAFLLFAATDMQAQLLKKLGKKAERAAERTIERRVERETEEKTDAALDSILEPGSEGPAPDVPASPPGGNDSGPAAGPSSGPLAESPAGADSGSIEVYSKFDFVPGDEVIFYDDFSNDFVGDFPSKWNTNGGGELVQINNSENKWLKLLPGFNTVYIPDVGDLPDEFTLEFDVIADGLDQKTSSQSYLRTIVSENTTFEEAANFVWVEYPFCQYAAVGTTVENKVNGRREIRNDIKVDVRKTVTRLHHVSIAVNKPRMRLWLDENKIVDVPRLMPENMVPGGLKFNLRGIDIMKEGIYISNIKVAKGGQDLRRTLIANGKVSTNGILFHPGSANLQPQSMGIIRQISQVLQQESGMNLRIVGHTDSDGSDASNIQLSKQRAEAVKNALVTIYTIDTGRLSTDGKGESEPVGDNATAEGKTQNRRVEFIKI